MCIYVLNVFVMNPSAPMQFFAKGLACCFSLSKSAYGKKYAIYETCMKSFRFWYFDNSSPSEASQCPKHLDDHVLEFIYAKSHQFQSHSH
jgi:hypothetical protein